MTRYFCSSGSRAFQGDLFAVYGPACRENLLDIGLDAFRDLGEQIVKLPPEMLFDGKAVDVGKILIDPDALKVTIGEGQANGRVGQHRVHLGSTLGNSPFQRCVEASDLLFHLLELGVVDEDSFPDDSASRHFPGPGT